MTLTTWEVQPKGLKQRETMKSLSKREPKRKSSRPVKSSLRPSRRTLHRRKVTMRRSVNARRKSTTSRKRSTRIPSSSTWNTYVPKKPSTSAAFRTIRSTRWTAKILLLLSSSPSSRVPCKAAETETPPLRKSEIISWTKVKARGQMQNERQTLPKMLPSPPSQESEKAN